MGALQIAVQRCLNTGWDREVLVTLCSDSEGESFTKETQSAFLRLLRQSLADMLRRRAGIVIAEEDPDADALPMLVALGQRGTVGGRASSCRKFDVENRPRRKDRSLVDA